VSRVCRRCPTSARRHFPRAGNRPGPAFAELGFYTLAGQPESSRDLIGEIRSAEELGLGSAFISERFDKKEAAFCAVRRAP